MSYSFYKLLHLLGLSLVLLATGGALVHAMNGGTKESNSWRKGIMISHGVGLLLLLVAGFGMLAKLGIGGMPSWVVGKILIWLALGALVVVAFKAPMMAKRAWFLAPALVIVAASLALYK